MLKLGMKHRWAGSHATTCQLRDLIVLLDLAAGVESVSAHPTDLQSGLKLDTGRAEQSGAQTQRVQGMLNSSSDHAVTGSSHQCDRSQAVNPPTEDTTTTWNKLFDEISFKVRLPRLTHKSTQLLCYVSNVESVYGKWIPTVEIRWYFPLLQSWQCPQEFSFPCMDQWRPGIEWGLIS